MTRRFVAALLVVIVLGSVPASVGAGEFVASSAPVSPSPSLETRDANAVGTGLEATDSGSDAVSLRSLTVGTTTTVGSSANATASSRMSAEPDLIRESVVLHQRPDRPGEFEAVVTYDVPEPVTQLMVTPGSEATVLETSEFEETDDGAYRWAESDHEGRSPQLTLRLPANRTEVGRHGHDGSGYTFAETGEWGIVATPQLQLAWRERSSVDVHREVAVDGEGVAGKHVAFFGANEVHETTAGSETIRLVVPEAADLEESPDDVLEALAHASERLGVGNSHSEVMIVAAPTGSVEWGAHGIQYGERDAWVRDDARLDVAGSVWLHEYVHTRQGFARSNLDRASGWLVEAQAEYYASLLTYERGDLDYLTFRRSLGEGRDSPYAEGVLTEPGTWQDPLTDYVKGPLVYGAIDRQLRLESDGESTMEDVFRAQNQNETATFEDWLADLEHRGGSDVREFAETYAGTASAPDTWNRFEHADAFDQPTPVMTYGLADGEEVEIEGLRETTTDGIPRTLVVGETVTFPVAVDNRGDREGPYRATVLVDDAIASEATGRLEPGKVTVERLSWTPETAGRYALHVGDDPFIVDVVDPADLTATALEASPDRVERGELITVTATVENEQSRVGRTTVEIRTVDGVVAEETVTLGPGESTTVETTLSFEDRGRHEIGAGDQRVTVTVESGIESRVSEGAESVPGFGVGAAIVAVALGLVLGRRSR
ncbi:CARDB domain-containing protein [Natronosalvus rutilus]|uniref:CARDB domain-containing protein n=1 Tax=Natronosalvus rutilus TaxID=2953753 RepID=A0A9E7SU08_9EURY|nr:CARDB domain-containing protein [Natronosalvus rutilus]UTF54234.1 hypothetical protein NGM29_02805 [Natronosalvus rutilus]